MAIVMIMMTVMTRYYVPIQFRIHSQNPVLTKEKIQYTSARVPIHVSSHELRAPYAQSSECPPWVPEYPTKELLCCLLCE